MWIDRQSVKSLFAGPRGYAFLGICAFMFALFPAWLGFWLVLEWTGWFDGARRLRGSMSWQPSPDAFAMTHDLVSLLLAALIVATLIGVFLRRRTASFAVIAAVLVLSVAFVAGITYASWPCAREDISDWFHNRMLTPGAPSL
jgi:uncharacterized membrane protein YqaE (UPF0057 family)